MNPAENRKALLVAVLLSAAHLAPALSHAQTGTTGGSAPVENRQPSLAMRYMMCIEGGIFPNDNPNGTPSQSSPPDRTFPFLGEIKAVPFNFAPRGWMLCEGQLLPINQNQALFALIGTTYGGNGVTTFALPDLRGRTPIGAGQGPGLPNYPLGTQVGAANFVLTEANLPPHAHTVGAGNTAPVGSGAPIDTRQPALALHFLIAANGEILIAPWPHQPTGWSQCDGRLLPRVGHTFLFSHIGDLYGGDGLHTLALPDTRGRLVIGDDGDYPDGPWAIATNDGENETMLVLPDIPAHSHSVSGGATGLAGGSGTTANNYQPSLAMRWMISFAGVFPTSSSSVQFPMVGELRLLASTGAVGLDSNWKRLDGALYPIEEAEPLFHVIGDQYGGDGNTTFAVPDLRARANMSAGAGVAFPLYLGHATMIVTILELAAHAHALVPDISVEQPAGIALADGFSNVDFGSVGAAGGTVEKTFTIRNVGAQDLTLGSFTQAGAADFTVGAPAATMLVPGATTTFTVSFAPATAGQRSATMQIPSNDADENPFDITLSGRRLTYQEEWRQEHFNKIVNGGAGADANDFERDGLSNFMEFAVGGDPKAFTPQPGALTRVGDTLEFTYQRAKGALADGFSFRVDFRSDLASGDWSNAGVTEEVISETTELEQVKASLAISPAQTRGFARLNVSAP